MILCRNSSNSGFAKMHPQEIEMYERCLSHNWHRKRMHGEKDFHFNTNECICLSWVSKRNWNRSRTKLLQSHDWNAIFSIFLHTVKSLEMWKSQNQEYRNISVKIWLVMKMAWWSGLCGGLWSIWGLVTQVTGNFKSTGKKQSMSKLAIEGSGEMISLNQPTQPTNQTQ